MFRSAREETIASPTHSPPWGAIGYVVFKRTYARRLEFPDTGGAASASGAGANMAMAHSPETEEWSDTLRRVVRGARDIGCGFSPDEEREFFGLMYNLKCSVGGRFLWQLNTPTVKRLGMLSLQNCAFTIVDDPLKPFTWTMDALCLGAGVGFNIQRQYVYKLPPVHEATITRLDTKDADFIVPDTREGWVKLIGKVLKAHYYKTGGFTYSVQLLRGAGAPIKGFGGTASGPEVLCSGVSKISDILNTVARTKHGVIQPIDCLDVMNLLGMIVRQFRLLLQLSQGDTEGINPYVIGKMRPQVRTATL